MRFDLYRHQQSNCVSNTRQRDRVRPKHFSIASAAEMIEQNTSERAGGRGRSGRGDERFDILVFRDENVDGEDVSFLTEAHAARFGFRRGNLWRA